MPVRSGRLAWRGGRRGGSGGDIGFQLAQLAFEQLDPLRRLFGGSLDERDQLRLEALDAVLDLGEALVTFSKPAVLVAVRVLEVLDLRSEQLVVARLVLVRLKDGREH